MDKDDESLERMNMEGLHDSENMDSESEELEREELKRTRELQCGKSMLAYKKKQVHNPFEQTRADRLRGFFPKCQSSLFQVKKKIYLLQWPGAS